MSRRPVTGADCAITTPGSRCAVGLITHTAYVPAKWRSTTRSFSTPFWKHATAMSARRARVERFARADRVLRLHREEHDVVGGEVELRRMIDDRDRERRVVVGRLDAQAVVADRLVVRAARDQHDVVTVLEHARADDAADRARAVDDESHRHGATAAAARGRTRARGRARPWWDGPAGRRAPR